MKKIYLIVMVGLLLPGLLAAKKTISLKTDEREYIAGGLSLNITIVGSWDAAIKEWKNPAVPDTPKIKHTTRFTRSGSVVPFITFETDALDKDGNAFITYDLIIIKPDGLMYINNKNLNVIKGKPTYGSMALKEPIICKIKPDDPVGKYTMRVRVYDHVRNSEVIFSLLFDVVK